MGYDGCMNFGGGEGWGLLGCLCLGWVMWEEKLFEGVKRYVDLLKVKG